jgi:hypothetical protein
MIILLIYRNHRFKLFCNSEPVIFYNKMQHRAKKILRMGKQFLHLHAQKSGVLCDLRGKK